VRRSFPQEKIIKLRYAEQPEIKKEAKKKD